MQLESQGLPCEGWTPGEAGGVIQSEPEGLRAVRTTDRQGSRSPLCPQGKRAQISLPPDSQRIECPAPPNTREGNLLYGESTHSNADFTWRRPQRHTHRESSAEYLGP